MSANQKPPDEPDIYPVTISDGTGSEQRVCARWDGEHWSLWCEMWDPPEWDRVEYLNCKVIEWRMP